MANWNSLGRCNPGFLGQACIHPCPTDTYVVSTVPDATPGSLPCDQKVHLGFPWTWAVQRLPASVDRVLHLLPEGNPATVMMQQMSQQMEFSTDPNLQATGGGCGLVSPSQNWWYSVFGCPRKGRTSPAPPHPPRHSRCYNYLAELCVLSYQIRQWQSIGPVQPHLKFCWWQGQGFSVDLWGQLTLQNKLAFADFVDSAASCSVFIF